ncbi:MAG: YadA C-terminal domain-containing protein, partial [Veillonella caviae]|nr:YadA C-terminal domain-containing protein [Veillonella caviae]
VKTYQVNVSDEAIKTAVKPELDQKANLDGSNLTPDAITNWKDQLGVTNVTNEVSGLNNRVDGLESNVSNLNNRVNKLDQRVDKVGAGAAALAGLHPLEFNPDDKFSASVAMGSYKGEGAAALGGFYRPNADTMFSISSTIGDDPMFNIGVSLKFGDKGDDIYRNANATNISALTNEVASLKAENKGLADQVASQKAELDKQRELIQQLIAKVGM